MKKDYEVFHANRAKNGRRVKSYFPLWAFAMRNSERHAARLTEIRNAAIEKAHNMLKQ